VKRACLACPSCERIVRLSSRRERCPGCAISLEVRVDVTGARPDPTAPTLLGRYRAFLPFDSVDPTSSLGEGGTPLVPAASLGRLLGVERLFFKLETLNPTGSSADRASVAGIQRARELGFTRIGIVSDGSLGRSLAAYGRLLGVRRSASLAGALDGAAGTGHDGRGDVRCLVHRDDGRPATRFAYRQYHRDRHQAAFPAQLQG
jgi:threonine synthase